MKKFIAVLLVTILLMSMVSCTSMEMLTDAGQQKYVFSHDMENLEQIKSGFETEIADLEAANKALDDDISGLNTELEELEKQKNSVEGDFSTIQRKFDIATDKGFGIRYEELIYQMMYLMDETEQYYPLSFYDQPINIVNDDGDNVLEYYIAADKNEEIILSYMITLTNDNVHIKKITLKAHNALDEELSIICGMHVAMMCTALFLAMDCPYYYDETNEEFGKNVVALMIQGTSNDGRAQFETENIGEYVFFNIEPSKKAADKKKY